MLLQLLDGLRPIHIPDVDGFVVPARKNLVGCCLEKNFVCHVSRPIEAEDFLKIVLIVQLQLVLVEASAAYQDLLIEGSDSKGFSNSVVV